MENQQHTPPQWEQQPQQNNSNDTVMSVLSYIGLLFLVPLLTKAHESSETVKFHLNQGIVFCICVAAANILTSFTRLFFGFIPFVGSIFGGLLSAAIGICSLVLLIIGISNAATGKQQPLPIIGNLFTIIK